MKKKNIAILQPEVPHYREEFFQKLQENIDMDIYIYNSIESLKSAGLKMSIVKTKMINKVQPKGFLLYNPFTLLSKRYDTLVLMLHFAHITTWLLLLTKGIHHKKIILWGQGISIKRYLQEEKKPDWRLKQMIRMADAAWIYMEKEAQLWQRIFPKKPITALNNTLTGVEDIVKIVQDNDPKELKQEYGIKEKTILLFCARFESKYRRTDLLLETIKRLDMEKFGFIIIGAGQNKPNFSPYKNVYDFGAVYDPALKKKLFCMADIYFQPGWVGLSIVEAMAYGKPVCTFVRSVETLQCVEYSYISHMENGLIFNSLDECIESFNNFPISEFRRMGENARCLVSNKLTISKMAENAYKVLQ